MLPESVAQVLSISRTIENGVAQITEMYEM
jgi:hypothetical protein